MHDLIGSIYPLLVLYLVALIVAQVLRRSRLKKARVAAQNGTPPPNGAGKAPAEPFLERVEPPEPSQS